MRRATVCSLLVLALAGCSFGFSGGGFPREVKTISVLPFDNDTSDPTLAQQVNLAVKQAVESRLGLRAAAEKQADAIVRGKVTRYDPDQPAAYRGNAAGAGNPNQVQVTRRQVELVVEVEIINQKTGLPIFAKKSIQVTGDYEPGREADGRKKALDLLVTNIVTEAQKNW